jgi:hypothetical protein
VPQKKLELITLRNPVVILFKSDLILYVIVSQTLALLTIFLYGLAQRRL